jgi:hypothetical protein
MDLGLGPAKECQFIGAEQKEWPYTFCGQKSLEGKSYCHDHYYVIYKKGSSNLKNNTKAIEKEIADIELRQLIAAQEADEGELANV